MKPSFHPCLVNGPGGDPVVYVDFLFEKRALLLDLGDIHTLSPRKILRISHIFVSHTHMDHFIGFDHIIRICLGRERRLEIYGPQGFIMQVEHRLAAYTWNLVENYNTDFTVIACELAPDGHVRQARFRCRNRFQREDMDAFTITDGLLLEEDTFFVRTAFLDHKIPCLAYAIEEKQHINIWKTRLEKLGYPTGPWLMELKKAVLRNTPDNTPFRIWWREPDAIREHLVPLGELKQNILRIVPGQKLVYVVDAVYHQENARRIIALANQADQMFIEAVFLDKDADRAAHTCHLTARQAGSLARRAGAKRVTPMHFSARYSDRTDALEEEMIAAYSNAAKK